VTSGKIRQSLRALAVPFKVGKGQIDPDNDLFVKGGWASVDTQGRVSAREGKTTPNEDRPDEAVDVWINDLVGWRNIPKEVWAFTLGGYPVINKWLSYREQQVLGRPITDTELVYVSEMVRRLTAVVELAEDLNKCFAECSKRSLSGK
jgi:hypothetical protein